MKLSIHLVTWNGSKYIPYLFDSLKKQTYQDFKLIILDNASSDDTVAKIKSELENVHFEYELIANKENKGFAGGHNQLFEGIRSKEKGESEYVLLLNQDMYLMSDCIEKLVKFMDEHVDAGAISPRLMKWNFTTDLTDTDHTDLLKGSFTNVVDSLGLKVLRNRRVIELGAGETYKLTDLQTYSLPVFGVSGALPMYRVSAINDVGLFDESFENYKEDVDLAFRLRSAGYKAYTILDAVVYHDRSAAGPENLSDATAVENKKKQSSWVKYHSYKNHLMTLYKNEYWQNFLLDLPWIKWYELKKFVYFLLYERSVLRGLGEVWKMRKDLKAKRLEIVKKRKIGWREIRRWWK